MLPTGRLAANTLMAAMLIVAAPTVGLAQTPSDVQKLNQQVVLLLSQGKYTEAATIAEKALPLAERAVGPEHPDTLESVDNLASLYQMQGRYDEAEPLFRRALSGYEKVLGHEHPSTLAS